MLSSLSAVYMLITLELAEEEVGLNANHQDKKIGVNQENISSLKSCRFFVMFLKLHML